MEVYSFLFANFQGNNAMAIDVIPASMRGLSSSIFGLLGSVIGGLPPLFVGALNYADPFGVGEKKAVRYSLLIVMGVAYSLAFLFQIVPIFTYKYDMKRTENEESYKFGKWFSSIRDTEEIDMRMEEASANEKIIN
jgi:hypothetical protein